MTSLKAVKTTQAKSAILRQIATFLVSAYGVVSASGVANHLPVAVTAVLTAAWPLLQLLEHFLSDPSTGNAKALAAAAEKVPELHKLSAEAKAELAKLLGVSPDAITEPSPPLFESGISLSAVPQSIGGRSAPPTPGA